MIVQNILPPAQRLPTNPDYALMGDDMQGGLHIPLNQPAKSSSDKRLRSRGGDHAADFPLNKVVDNKK